MGEKLLYKIQVRGRVQGVGFRWNALKAARSSGVNGIVKNLSDGSVYIEAEGSPEQLGTFIEWCKRGPDFGLVESLEVDTLPPVNYPDFRIEY